MFNVIDMITAWKVQVSTATAEDTIISKLEWSKASNSERQLVDVAGILRVRSTNLDVEYIERWVDALDLRPQWDRARGLTQ